MLCLGCSAKVTEMMNLEVGEQVAILSVFGGVKAVGTVERLTAKQGVLAGGLRFMLEDGKVLKESYFKVSKIEGALVDEVAQCKQRTEAKKARLLARSRMSGLYDQLSRTDLELTAEDYDQISEMLSTVINRSESRKQDSK
jgi:hypothetical protein